MPVGATGAVEAVDAAEAGTVGLVAVLVGAMEAVHDHRDGHRGGTLVLVCLFVLVVGPSNASNAIRWGGCTCWCRRRIERS